MLSNRFKRAIAAMFFVIALLSSSILCFAEDMANDAGNVQNENLNIAITDNGISTYPYTVLLKNDDTNQKYEFVIDSHSTTISLPEGKYTFVKGTDGEGNKLISETKHVNFTPDKAYADFRLYADHPLFTWKDVLKKNIAVLIIGVVVFFTFRFIANRAQ